MPSWGRELRAEWGRRGGGCGEAAGVGSERAVRIRGLGVRGLVTGLVESVGVASSASGPAFCLTSLK